MIWFIFIFQDILNSLLRNHFSNTIVYFPSSIRSHTKALTMHTPLASSVLCLRWCSWSLCWDSISCMYPNPWRCSSWPLKRVSHLMLACTLNTWICWSVWLFLRFIQGYSVESLLSLVMYSVFSVFSSNPFALLYSAATSKAVCCAFSDSAIRPVSSAYPRL